jgi:chromosome segregation ATPase
LRRRVKAALDQLHDTEREIEQTRTALAAHEKQAPQDSSAVPAWSSRRADLATRIESYASIAAAQRSRYEGLAWQVAEAVIAFAERRIPPADAAVEKAEQEAQRLVEQARAVRRAARSQRDTIQRLIADAEAHGIAIFAEVPDGR